jgi:hypothetical protein
MPPADFPQDPYSGQGAAYSQVGQGAGYSQGNGYGPGPAQAPGYGPGGFPYGQQQWPGGQPGPEGLAGAGGLAGPGQPAPDGQQAPQGGRQPAGTVIRQRDSALPDPLALSSSGPIAAIETDSVASFARDLRVLRSQADLDYPDMAEKSHYTMRTLASAAGGLRLPTLPVLMAYVRACDGDLSEWEERWDKLMKADKDSQAATPSAGADSGRPAGAPATRAAPGAAPAGSPDGGAAGPAASSEVYIITSAPDRDPR